MTQPFLGEILLAGFNFAPQGNAFCAGQIIPISQNTALFSLLGVQYGGNGTSNFALPNLQGRAVMGMGNGPGLSPRSIGEQVGAAGVTLTINEMPSHTHGLSIVNGPANRSATPTGTNSLSSPTQTRITRQGTTAGTPMHPQAIGLTGGNLAHENRQPYLGLNYSIALQGVFPARQ